MDGLKTIILAGSFLLPSTNKSYMKKRKKIFIISGVVVFLIGVIILANTVFYSQINGKNYNEVNYVSNEGYEVKFPASPDNYYGRTAEIKGRQIQFSSTGVLMKDSATYFVDYLTIPLNDIQVNEDFIKDLIAVTNSVSFPEYDIVSPLENWGEIQRFEITNKILTHSKFNVIFDPAYESFWVIRVFIPDDKDIDSRNESMDSFISSFKLTYLDEDQALTDFYSNLESDNINLQNQLASNSQSYQSQISKLKSEIQSLGTMPSTNSYTTAEASSFWSQYTVKLSCNFAGEFTAEGSGLLIEDGVITNAHVFTEEVDGVLYGPDYCTVSSPKLSGSVTVEFDPDDYLTVDGVDFGEILISNPTSQMRGLMDDGVLDKMCDPQNVAIGDEMIVLGYPYTGSTQSVTVTDGIVSGFENNFYVTSTKIEHGNSGGVAVLIKDNCYLGVPTFVASGELESLGRILDVYSFFYY